LGGDKFGRDSLVHQAPITTKHQHPVEISEKNFKIHQDKAAAANAARMFGSGFALQLTHERAAVSMIRSNNSCRIFCFHLSIPA